MRKTVSLLLVLWALWPMVAAAQSTNIEMTDTVTPLGEVGPNEIVDLVVSFRNDDIEPMADLTWTADLLPVGRFSFDSAVDLQGAVVVSSGAELVIEYPVDLLPGETLELHYRLRATSCFSSQGSTVSHGGLWTATLPVNEPVGASALTGLPILNANSVLYDVVKTASVSEASPGDEIDFSIQVINQLAAFSTGNVFLRDVIPTGTTLVDAPAFSCDGSTPGSLCENVFFLDCAETAEFSLRLRVADSIPANLDEIVNTAVGIRGQFSEQGTAVVQLGGLFRDLTITKTDGGATALPGEDLTYSFEVTNLGNTSATNVIVQDFVPHEVEFDAELNPRWSYDPGTRIAQYLGGSVPGGATQSIQLHVRVQETLPAVDGFENQAVVTTADPETDTTNNSATEFTPIDESVIPDLELALEAAQATVLPDGQVDYVVTITNLGPIGARDVGAVLSFDALLDFLPGAGSDPRWQIVGSQQLQADLGILGGGETTSLAVATLAQPGFPAGTSELSASGTTSTIDPEPDLTNNSASLALPLDSAAQPDPAIQKTASGGPARPGETLTYLISVDNLGALGATSVAVEDVLPDEVTWVPANSDPRWAFANGVLTASLGVVEPSEAESLGIEVRVNDTLPAGTESILNVVSVETPDPEQTLENNTASAQTPLAEDVLPDLRVTKAADLDEVRPGDLLTYQIEVQNAGPIGTRDVSVEDVLPDQVQWIAGDSDPRWQPSGNVLQADLGMLDGQATESLVVVVQIDEALDAGTIQFLNQASAETSDPESDGGNNTDTVVTPLADDVFPDLRVDKQLAEGTPSPGQQLLYSIVIENTAEIDSGPYSVTESLPSQVVFLPGDSSPEWTQTGQQLSAQFANLEAGATRTLEVAVQVPVDIDADDLTLFNEVNLDAPADEEPSNNTDSTSHEVILPDLAVVKSDQDAVVQPGLIYSYIISVTAENAPVTDIAIVEDLPDEVTWLPENSDEIWVASSDGNPTATIQSLEAGVTRELLLTVQVSESLPAGLEELVNHVQVDSPMTDADGSNEEATEVTPIVEGLLPNLAVTKTASVETAEVGDEFSYTILVESNGVIGASEVRVVDLVSPDTEIVDAGSWTCAGLECVFEGGALEVGDLLELDLVVRVLDTVTSSVVVNQAQLTLPDTASTDNLAEATVQLTEDGEPLTPDARVDLLGPAEATVGETFHLEIPYGNDSALQATEVVLAVALPPELEPVDLIAGWTCSFAAGWTCELPVGILPGLSESATALAILPSAEGTYEAQATISAFLDGNLANNVAAWSVIVGPGGPEPEVDVGVEKTGEQVGAQAVTWTLRLRSLGQLDAANIEIHDMLPESVVEVDDPACSVDTRSCTWFFDELPSGETTEWTFTTVHDETGLVTNEVQVQAPGDARPENDEASASVTLTEPSVLAVQKRDRLLTTDEWPAGIPDDIWAVIEYEVVIDILEPVESPVFELIDSTSPELRYLGHFEGDGSVTIVDGDPVVSFSGEAGVRVFRYLAGIQVERPQVRCQGQVRSESHDSVVSDDPDTAVLFDPTVTRFDDGGSGEDPYPIPTLSEWGLLLLVGMLVIVASRRISRAQAAA
ncbi:MAG: DUF11 domain-containing protein [Thermoanaerobaculia bacterium]|nr:DUF11 domain-containing protein [Thermoanaerobaculia bacterium]